MIRAYDTGDIVQIFLAGVAVGMILMFVSIYILFT